MANSAITALKQYAKVDSDKLDFRTLQKNIASESDRSALIMLTSAVEDVLVTAIKAKLKDAGSDLRSNLFDWNGPLGSFSARIKIARAFGIIDQATYRDLNDIREIRNACAHSQKPISFAVDEVKDALLAMLRREGGWGPYLRAFIEKGDFKQVATYQAIFLITAIRQGSREGAIRLLGKVLKSRKERGLRDVVREPDDED